ncbi:radical SAM family heme chaperone HemW [Thalassospira lucentensis]|uniref:radical SAM family heme chaperone HemW n=1 Tax=Thalassospira lucentensis TaxID=168935 RepID=UPI0029437ED6|nr:radical SAM family heme chaperone HemW [Thalassospira lucentensis]WOI12396.1 radical SAM family heme chaperone HemW [Thalassospira lucentensis]
MSQANAEAVPFGIYIHWPFCLSKCPYCDFNSHVADKVDHARWRAALRAELAAGAARHPGRTVGSVFFGGGTPSLMDPETAGALIADIKTFWPVTDDIEITLEANPGTVEINRFSAFAANGINRVSIGIQALNDRDLKFLGRVHNSAEAMRALDVAANVFDRFSFDLIYARPEHDRKAWRRELREALDIARGHISLYQLTIEPGTQFYTLHQRGDLVVPDEDLATDLYEITQEETSAAGYGCYEISNHARPGQESRHNLVYWRYGDYLGIGPGAHGREAVIQPDGSTKPMAVRRHRAPDIWLDRVEKQGHGTQEEMALAADERLIEMVMMGLRLNEAIPTLRFERIIGKGPREALDSERLETLIVSGDLVCDLSGLRATDQGRNRLNGVLRYLFDHSA